MNDIILANENSPATPVRIKGRGKTAAKKPKGFFIYLMDTSNEQLTHNNT